MTVSVFRMYMRLPVSLITAVLLYLSLAGKLAIRDRKREAFNVSDNLETLIVSVEKRKHHLFRKFSFQLSVQGI